MALGDDELDLMRCSMQAAVKDAALVSQYFHEALFRAAPETRQLYRMDLAQQGQMLINRMSMIMARMHDVESLRPFVEDLAIRHAEYGVRPEHYPLVGAALLVALKRLMGASFTPEAEAAWTEAYDQVSAIMIEIAYGKEAASGAD